MSLRSRGHTLAEMIVAGAVFFAVLAVGTDLLVHAFRSTASGELRQTALDETRGFLYRVSDELRRADEILDPDWNVLVSQGSPYIVFRMQGEVVGYRLAGNRVERLTWPATYTAGRQWMAPLSSRFLTTDPSTLWFRITGGGLPPGQGGVAPGQDGDPGGGVAVALGHFRSTVQVQVSVTPAGAAPLAMRTKKTLWAGLYPEPKDEPAAEPTP